MSTENDRAETSSTSSTDSTDIIDKKADTGDAGDAVDANTLIALDDCKKGSFAEIKGVSATTATLRRPTSDADVQHMEEGERHYSNNDIVGDEDEVESAWRTVFLILAFLLGMLTVPVSLIVIVSLWIFPCLPDEWRENSFTFAATIGSVCGFFVFGILLVVMQGISAFN